MKNLVWLLTFAVGVGAQAQGGLLVVVNQKEHAVLLVDPVALKPVATVSVGVNGHEVAASLDGRRLYVPIYGDSGVGRPGTDGRMIDVIDVASRKVVQTIDLGRPLRPHKDAFGPDGMLYVTGELADQLEIVDPAQGKVVGTIPTGAEQTHLFALTRDGRRAYTANVGAGSVSVLDVPGRKLVTVIPLAKRLQRMALSVDEHWAFTSDQDQPRVAVVDTSTNTLSRWVATSAKPYVTQPTPDGKYLLVAESSASGGLLEVFDLATWRAVRSFALKVNQNGGFLVHDGTVYLSEPLGGTIERLRLSDWTMQAPIVMTLGVDGLAWAR